MGIRFTCPNGHKLHVKEFQAGLRGICPQCGARMMIPHKSTRLSSRQRRASMAGGLLGSDSGSPDDASALDGDDLGSDEEILAAISGLSGPAPQAVADDPDDPLAAGANNAVWYVRPPSGGQFGPATTEVIRSWLAEGRISGDTYVWREGWPDWREAVGVFPQLSFNRTFPEFDKVVPAESTPVASTPQKWLSLPKNKLLVAGLAVLAVVSLLVAMFFMR